MAHEMPGYGRAQREWEAMEPPSGPGECHDCKGKGRLDCDFCHGDGADKHGVECSYCQTKGSIRCTTCTGFGLLTDDGKPFDPSGADDYDDRGDRDEDRPAYDPKDDQ